MQNWKEEVDLVKKAIYCSRPTRLLQFSDYLVHPTPLQNDVTIIKKLHFCSGARMWLNFVQIYSFGGLKAKCIVKALCKNCVGRGWLYIEWNARGAAQRCSSLPTNDRPEQMVSLLKFYYTTIPLVMSDCDSIVTIHILCITVDQILPQLHPRTLQNFSSFLIEPIIFFHFLKCFFVIL